MASGWREFKEAGGLLSYGPNRAQIARRIAYYVDKILRRETRGPAGEKADQI